jgi:hypothetical protein
MRKEGGVMKASDVLYKRLRKAKEEYLRVFELHKSGETSLLDLEHRKGYFDGVEQAWREIVCFEIEQEKNAEDEIRRKVV